MRDGSLHFVTLPRNVARPGATPSSAPLCFRGTPRLLIYSHPRPSEVALDRSVFPSHVSEPQNRLAGSPPPPVVNRKRMKNKAKEAQIQDDRRRVNSLLEVPLNDLLNGHCDGILSQADLKKKNIGKPKRIENYSFSFAISFHFR